MRNTDDISTHMYNIQSLRIEECMHTNIHNHIPVWLSWLNSWAILMICQHTCTTSKVYELRSVHIQNVHNHIHAWLSLLNSRARIGRSFWSHRLSTSLHCKYFSKISICYKEWLEACFREIRISGARPPPRAPKVGFLIKSNLLSFFAVARGLLMNFFFENVYLLW